jgi:hypothetical protein
MSIKIKRNEAGNCINFEGTSNPVYFNACLSGEVDSTDNTLVNVINDVTTAQLPSGEKAYEFFRIPYTEFLDADGNTFSSATDTADYITVNGNVSAPADINVGYKGVYDASVNVIPSDASPINGDWYYIGVAGTINTVDYEVNDIIKYSDTTTTWSIIKDQSVSVNEIESSSLDRYSIHLDADYTGTVRTGSSVHPYNDLQTAINASVSGDSLLVKGVNVITAEIVLPHELSFYGSEGSEIKFANYDSANGDIFSFVGDGSQTFIFKDITFRNAGGYGLLLKQTEKVELRNCKFFNNGWSGNGLSTVLAEVGGVLGYDSDSADLQAFYASSNASNGGAVRIEQCRVPLIRECRAENNLRGLRIQDCGINGGGFIIENQSLNNIESGIYLASGSLSGCQNMTVTINYSSYNANNGLLCIGGMNNKFSQNEVNGNWNAGFCAWGSANTTLRDSGLYDNNRSTYNGIGNTGDAKASIQINEAYDLLGTQISINSAFRFIAEILDTQVHYTGLGSNTDKIGFLIDSSVGALENSPKNIIKVDDVGFIGQDYAIDLSEVDVSNLRLSLGDNSYQSIGLKAVKAPLVGNYTELPFSNHVMEVPSVDVVVDTLKQTIALHEGVGGNVINVYGINELQSVLKTSSIDIIQKSSDKIQLRDLTLGNVYINGSLAGSNVNTMNDSLNGAFNMDLTEYKEFIETEVGVVGGDESATFYYIESPDGTYHYPLFKTEAEANAVDTDLTGSGSSHTHTYVDDLTNTTWYMPDVSNHMSSSVMPVNGLYTAPNGEEIESVVWNIQVTDVDSNYAPTFTDLTFTVAEQSAVNLVYKPAGDTSTYNVTSVPTGYADTGSAIVGTAETITNGIDIVHTLNVTKANAFGSDTGTITFTVSDDPTNNVNPNSTSWNKAVDFSGSNERLQLVTTGASWNALRMNGISAIVSSPSTTGYTSNGSNSRPWATTIVFKSDSNNSNQHIWNSGEGASAGNDNIYLRLSSTGYLYFGWNREGTGINECILNTSSPINSSTWYGVYIAHNGTRYSASNATASNLASAFDIRLMSSADSFNSLGSEISTSSNWTSTGLRMDRATLGSFCIGGRDGNRNFHGKVASMVIASLKRNVAMPTDVEIKLMITDPIQWRTDYLVNKTVRQAGLSTNATFLSSNIYNGFGTIQMWLMGDGGNDSFSNGIRNRIYSQDQNYSKLQFNSMQSNDIQNVSISGLS